MKWKTTLIKTIDGEHEAIAPEIISASRATDIPAFHAEWFIRRLRAGYLKWINPFNHKSQCISLKNVKVIIFWSKNPQPIIKYLPEIDERDIKYYFQYTVNDYEKEGFEPNVPPLDDRIDTFRLLCDMLGPESVVWRFDPLILTDLTNVENLYEKVRLVGNKVHQYTRRLIFSFADINNYSKVQRNLTKANIGYREFTDEDIQQISSGISELCKKWMLDAFTCGEKIDLLKFWIAKGKCIDDQLILKITKNDPEIRYLFGLDKSDQLDLFGTSTWKNIKDKGQRQSCGCVFSKDIGQYNTCLHLCTYCYANFSPDLVRNNAAKCNLDSESIL